MGALVNRCTGRNIDAFLLVDLLDVGISGDTGISCNNLFGPSVEGGAHDRAPGSPLGQDGKRRKTGRGSSREGTKGGGFGMPKEGASRFEADERREFVHPDKNQKQSNAHFSIPIPSQSHLVHQSASINYYPITSPLDPMSSIFLKVQ